MLLKFIVSIIAMFCIIPSLAYSQILIIPPFPGGVAVTNTGDKDSNLVYIFPGKDEPQAILSPGERVSFHTWDFDQPLLGIFSSSEDVSGTFIY